MTVVVLGAGVIGITTAYHLARSGASVIVIDRESGPGLGASFANGGQISANHVTPWATPSAPWKALKWLGQVDAPLLLHVRWDPALYAWLYRFLANCRRSRVRVNIERALRIALYSRSELARLRTEIGIDYDQLARGILHIFRNLKEYEDALPGVELMNRLGCTRRIVDARGCIALEPALASIRPQLIGGVFSPDDESGDAHLFTHQLAEICEEIGVRFQYGIHIHRLLAYGDKILGVDTDAGLIEGDAYVVALGSYSPQVLKTIGIRLPVYPGKGYSVTIPVENSEDIPTVSLIDDEFKMVYSRLGDRLRVAGTAEFIGYNETVVEARARFLLRKALELFPACGAASRVDFWAGLRPSTPDGVPVMGATRFANLFLNTGHGTLGWTMAAGSGRVVSDLVMGREPEISVDGLSLDRFIS